jgi:hypothetical protein
MTKRLAELPAAVFVVAILILGGWMLQAFGVKPEDISLWLSLRVLYDMELAVVLLPWLAVLAFLTGLVFMVAQHHAAALIAAGLGAALIAIDILWHVGVGDWVTAHLSGAA